jgi:glycosyltransferase involved in cell wall biosynthesis
MDASGDPRVVLVHDWLTGMRGGEKCLEAVCRRWPHARLFTLLHHPGSVAPAIERLNPVTTLLQRLPGVERYYRSLLPLMPLAAESWRLPPCELVISFSHCVAKAARAPRGVPHVCYCFTPMRYAWHLRRAYFGLPEKGDGTCEGRGPVPFFGGFKARIVERWLEALCAWDRRTAARVTHFVAISRTVQSRIADCYGRPSTVIYPPVDVDFYCPAPSTSGPREDYYLAVSALSPYKRLDLAVTACNRLRRPLLIMGAGPEEKRLRALAGPTVRFLGWQPDEVIRDHLRCCRALLFPGEEDFGLVPVEANACATPVIAFGRGGATETIIPPGGRHEPTGLWFAEQTADCLADAMQSFEASSARAAQFDPAAMRRQALNFNPGRFAEELFGYLDGVLRPATVAVRRAA